MEAVHDRLDPKLSTLAATGIESGIAFRTGYNQSAARDWARQRCPGGPDRDFGGCVARDGVVVQERAGETHVLAVALDVTITTDRGSRRVTIVR